jgi:lipoprotein-anchoring transpeptidase ErfK/SrfK
MALDVAGRGFRCGVVAGVAAALALGVALAAAGPVRAWPGGEGVEQRARLSLAEDRWPVVAEVVADGVAVRAYPKEQSDVRRQANAGDLLRVTGRAPGIDGDANTWWATTEGFVPLDVLQPASSPHAANWTLPEPDAAPNGWWGEFNMRARVRTSPSTDAPVVGFSVAGQRVKVLAEQQGTPIDGDPAWSRIDGGRFAGGWVHGSTVTRIDQPRSSAAAPEGGPADRSWIVVDRGARTLTLVQGGQPTFATFVAIGKAGAETPTGAHGLVSKHRFDDMTSLRNPDALNPYYLPNVPSVQYYLPDGSAIHGTYWHDSFGTPESQGCVNLTLTDAAYLFEQTRPEVSGGETEAWSVGGGTPVVIVD